MSGWFRMYSDVVNNPKVQLLPDDVFKMWVNILCIASENGGILPSNEELAFKLRASLQCVLHVTKTLIEAKLLTVTKNQHGETIAPYNWQKRQYKSDGSADRVKRYRDRKKAVTCNAVVTPPEQNRSDTDIIPLPLPTISDKSSSSVGALAPKKSDGGNLGKRLDEGWQLPNEWGQWAYGLGMTREEILAQADAFRDYWVAVPGAKGRKADWQATWRNWCRRAAEKKNGFVQRK